MSADITQVRELEDRLTQLGLLIGSVSHSLKGLLNGLGGGMYLVNSGFAKGDEARVKKGWATVQRNADRIKAMVSDILYYAKDRIPNWETLSATEVAEDVVTMMEPRARELAVGIRRGLLRGGGELRGGSPGRSGPPGESGGELAGRLSAGREARDGHEVMVRVGGDAGRASFEVEDDGIGMDQETQEKAFTLFFSSKGTGTGLGLFISDKIARAHGGEIGLHSTPGEGTRFIVRLPRVRPAVTELPASPMTKGTTIHA